MSSVSAHIREKVGAAAMRSPPTREELYSAVDTITETIKNHKERLDLLEGKQPEKPKVRVQAGSVRI